MNPFATKESSKTTNKDDDEKSLQGILKKLRPFQREAYDFATLGKISNRQWSSSDNKDNPPTKNEFYYDTELLGKGRILLAGKLQFGIMLRTIFTVKNSPNHACYCIIIL
jgi:hypothetical protein